MIYSRFTVKVSDGEMTFICKTSNGVSAKKYLKDSSFNITKEENGITHVSDGAKEYLESVQANAIPVYNTVRDQA